MQLIIFKNNKNRISPCTHPLILKRFVSGKPGSNLSNFGRQICSKNHHGPTQYHPTKSSLPHTPSIAEIDSKLPDNPNFHTPNTSNVPTSTVGSSSGQKSTAFDNPISQSFNAIKKWGKDAVNPSGRITTSSQAANCNLASSTISTAQKNQALHEETYGKIISILSSSNDSLAKDELYLLNKLRQELKDHPLYNNKAGQLTLETFFARHRFELKNVESILGPNLKLEDIIGMNNGLVDQSSIFTILQTQAFLSSLQIKVESVVIVETPYNLFDLSDLSPKAQKFILNSKIATGNTVCDVKLEDHLFDYKITSGSSPGAGKNHIQPIAAYNSVAINRYLTSLESHLKEQSKINPDAELKDYYAKTLKTLQDIKNEKSISPIEQIKLFNAYTIQELPNRPVGCYYSLLHTLGDPSYIPNHNSEYTRLAREHNFPQNKHPQPSDVVAANKNYIAKQSEKTKDLIHKRTNGIYGSLSTDSYPDEVD